MSATAAIIIHNCQGSWPPFKLSRNLCKKTSLTWDTAPFFLLILFTNVWILRGGIRARACAKPAHTCRLRKGLAAKLDPQQIPHVMGQHPCCNFQCCCLMPFSQCACYLPARGRHLAICPNDVWQTRSRQRRKRRSF